MAASASSVRAGAAYVELFTKNNLQAGLVKAKAQLQAFGSAVSSLGTKIAATGFGIKAFFGGAGLLFASTGADLLEMSQRLGITVEDLATLKGAAATTGVEMESLEAGFRKMAATISDAASGNRQAEETLRRLGVSAGELLAMTPDKQFERLATGLMSIQNPTLRASAAIDIFGRGGLALLPILSRGGEGIAQLRSQFAGSWTTEAAKDAQTLRNAFLALEKATKGILIAIGAGVAPILQEDAELFTKIAKSVRDFIRQNIALVKILAYTGSALIGLGIAMKVFGAAISIVGTGIGLLGTAFMVFGAVASAALALVSSPLLAIVAGIGLVTGGIVALVLRSRGSLTTLSEGFRGLGQTAVTTWDGISNAIASGNWALAARIAMAGLQLAWRQVVATMRTVWADFTAFFVDGWEKAVYRAAQLMTQLSTIGISFANLMAGQNPVQAAMNANANNAPIAGQLGQMETEEQAERERRRRAAAKAAALADKAEMARLRAELEALTNQAALDRLRNKPFDYTHGKKPPITDPEQMARSIEARGTFSSFAISGLGAMSTTERLLTQIERNTRANAEPAFT